MRVAFYDALRDGAARAAFERVLVTAPDRLARNYVHQMVLLEELARLGCPVQFVDRPPRDDPHEQLVVQIRGAVAEYERMLIADRMRRGRHAKLQSGRLLPWTRPPYGYRADPERPRDPSLVQLDPPKAAVVEELFDAYAAGGASLYLLATRLTRWDIPSPTGRGHWTASAIRCILTNPAYVGRGVGEDADDAGDGAAVRAQAGGLGGEFAPPPGGRVGHHPDPAADRHGAIRAGPATAGARRPTGWSPRRCRWRSCRPSRGIGVPHGLSWRRPCGRPSHRSPACRPRAARSARPPTPAPGGGH